MIKNILTDRQLDNIDLLNIIQISLKKLIYLLKMRKINHENNIKDCYLYINIIISNL